MRGFTYNLLFGESPALSLVCVTGGLFVKRLGARSGQLLPSVAGDDHGRRAALDTTLCNVMVDGSGWLSGFFHAVWTTVEENAPSSLLACCTF